MDRRRKRLPFEVTHPYRRETYTIELPANYQVLFERIENPRTSKSDYENSAGMLYFFLDVYDKLNEEDRIEFQDLANCGIARTDTIADLLKLLLTRYKYYRLYGVGNLYELGKERIRFMRKEHPESATAKLPYSNSYRLGKRILIYQQGVFYKNSYFALLDCYAGAEDDD